MQSQRELFERQIALERAEMEAMPEEEEAELAAAYRAKGFPPEEAARIAHRIFKDPAAALDTLVREELGLDPDQLGSPVGAAFGSFLAFALGAAVPVIPYLFGGGTVVVGISLGISLVALFAVGAAVSLLTGRGLVFSGMRQLVIGLVAALVDVRHRDDHRRGDARGSGDPMPADERTLTERLIAEGWHASSWSNGPGDEYRAHQHDYDKVLVVSSGSIRFGLPATGDAVELGSATGSTCPPGPATTRSSDRTG